jgi:hypothetical protein
MCLRSITSAGNNAVAVFTKDNAPVIAIVWLVHARLTEVRLISLKLTLTLHTTDELLKE